MTRIPNGTKVRIIDRHSFHYSREGEIVGCVRPKNGRTEVYKIAFGDGSTGMFFTDDFKLVEEPCTAE